MTSEKWRESTLEDWLVSPEANEKCLDCQLFWAFYTNPQVAEIE